LPLGAPPPARTMVRQDGAMPARAVIDSDGGGAFTIRVNGSAALHRLPSRFVSYTMDAGSLAHFAQYKAEVWDDPLTRALARHLAPAIFRLGGTEEDYTEYNFEATPGDGTSCAHLLPVPTRTCAHLNGTKLDTIAAFARAVGWDLVWGINVGTARDATTNAWDPSQFAALLAHARRVNLSFYGLELGNEPDLMCVGPHNERYSCHHPPPNTSWGSVRAISPAQLADDYTKFRGTPIWSLQLLTRVDLRRVCFSRAWASHRDSARTRRAAGGARRRQRRCGRPRALRTALLAQPLAAARRLLVASLLYACPVR
jgi:hypothetical protein